MIKVSIIIPVYNVSKYIERCLQSVYLQTYTNIEVLIIDDCGKDNSMQLINLFLDKITDSRFRIIHHPENRGLSAARNSGIKESSGDYIYFIDSDDYITENCIETFVEVIRQHPNSDVVFGSAIFYPNNWGNYCINVKKSNIPISSNNKKWIKSNFYQDDFFPITAWNKLISKDFIIRNALYFKEGIVYEDQLWYFLMGNYCNIISFNKNDTYFYQNNSTGIMHNYGIKEIDSEITIIKECLNHIDYRYFLLQLVYIMHFAHVAYCRRYGSSQPSYIRYPKAFVFFLKCIFMKPEHLRK